MCWALGSRSIRGVVVLWVEFRIFFVVRFGVVRRRGFGGEVGSIRRGFDIRRVCRCLGVNRDLRRSYSRMYCRRF